MLSLIELQAQIESQQLTAQKKNSNSKNLLNLPIYMLVSILEGLNLTEFLHLLECSRTHKKFLNTNQYWSLYCLYAISQVLLKYPSRILTQLKDKLLADFSEVPIVKLKETMQKINTINRIFTPYFRSEIPMDFLLTASLNNYQGRIFASEEFIKGLNPENFVSDVMIGCDLLGTAYCAFLLEQEACENPPNQLSDDPVKPGITNVGVMVLDCCPPTPPFNNERIGVQFKFENRKFGYASYGVACFENFMDKVAFSIIKSIIIKDIVEEDLKEKTERINILTQFVRHQNLSNLVDEYVTTTKGRIFGDNIDPNELLRSYKGSYLTHASDFDTPVKTGISHQINSFKSVKR